LLSWEFSALNICWSNQLVNSPSCAQSVADEPEKENAIKYHGRYT
jgi:hypothetical protein